MHRRTFIRSATAVAALAATTPLIGLVGCAVNAKDLLNTLIASLQALLRVATPNAPWAAQLQAALTALQSAEQDWVSGGTVNVIDDALNTVEAVLAVIPLTAAYSPLVDVAVAGIEAVLAVLFPPTANAKATAVSDPHRGRAHLNKPHFMQSHQGAYREQWNHVASSISLPAARI